jgi:hypothetical protein
MSDLRETITRVLVENGVSGNLDMHSWRCQYPERYGECDCVADLIDDLVKQLAPQVWWANQSRWYKFKFYALEALDFLRHRR